MATATVSTASDFVPPPRLAKAAALAPIQTSTPVASRMEAHGADELTPLDRFRRSKVWTPGCTPNGTRSTPGSFSLAPGSGSWSVGCAPFARHTFSPAAFESKDGFGVSSFRRQRSRDSSENSSDKGGDGFGATSFSRQTSGNSCVGTSSFARQRSGGSCRPRSEAVSRAASPSPQARTTQSIKCALIIDWDDTLFPTTWLRQDCGLDWRVHLDKQLFPDDPRSKHIKEAMQRYGDQAAQFLHDANSQSHVVIVTLATRDWVRWSVERFCPAMEKALEECNCQIIYAQEYEDSTPHRGCTARDTEEEEKQFWTNVKASAIREVLSSQDVIWTDIMSIGDSEYERQGTIQVCKELNEVAKTEGEGTKAPIVLRTKTLKSLEDPTVEELCAQHAIFLRWLPYMVDLDGNLDIEIDSSDDALLNELDALVTGRVCVCGLDFPENSTKCPECNMHRPRGPPVDDRELSWLELAGMIQDSED